MTKYPPLRTDAETGPPDAIRGFDAVMAWACGDPLALAMRFFTTDANVRLALDRYHSALMPRLRDNPGPYSNYVGEYDSYLAMQAIREIAL